MSFRVVPVETMTGRRILPWVETGEYQWKSSLTTPGDGSFPLHLRDQTRWGGRMLSEMRAIADRLTQGWATTYVVETGPDSPRPGEIVYAGPVVEEPSWVNGVLTVRTREIAAILDRRPLFTASEMETVRQRTYSGPSMAGVIRDVFYGALRRPALGEDVLPVDVPSGAVGDLVTKQIFRYNFPTAQQVLDDIAAEGGPDWYLRPYWSGTLLRWSLEVGSPNLDGPEIRLPVSTPQSPVKTPVTNFLKAESFQDQYTHIAAVGAGSEEDMRWAQHYASPPAGVPAMFKTDSHKHLDDRIALASVARASAQRSSSGIRQFSYGLQLSEDDRITPDMIRVGAKLLFDHPGDELITPGRYREYVMDVSGGSSLNIQAESQEV